MLGIASLGEKGPLYIPPGNTLGVCESAARWHLFFQHCGLDTTDTPGAHVLNNAILVELLFGVGDSFPPLNCLWLHANGYPQLICIEDTPSLGFFHYRTFSRDGILLREETRFSGDLSSELGPAVIKYMPDGSVSLLEYWLNGEQLPAEAFARVSGLRSARNFLPSNEVLITSIATVNV